MRQSIIVVGTVMGTVVGTVALGLGLAILAGPCGVAALDEDARLAIELGCEDRADRAQDQCRARLRKLYLSRALDPDKTLRAYCERVRDARWGGARPSPPRLCVERYGGWG